MEEMEDKIKILKECKKCLQKFMEYAVDCETVTDEEYSYVGDLSEKINDEIMESKRIVREIRIEYYD